MPKKN